MTFLYDDEKVIHSYYSHKYARCAIKVTAILYETHCCIVVWRCISTGAARRDEARIVMSPAYFTKNCHYAIASSCDIARKLWIMKIQCCSVRKHMIDKIKIMNTITVNYLNDKFKNSTAGHLEFFCRKAMFFKLKLYVRTKSWLILIVIVSASEVSHESYFRCRINKQSM